MLISNAAIKNRTTVVVLMLLIGIAGATSYLTLPREASPDVKIPVIMITTTQDGVSPEDIENNITKEIEKEVASVKGLKEIRSSSAEGTSMITVEFYPDVLIEDALQRVRDKVDLAKAEIPSDAEEPIITDINIAEFPIMMINISGTISPIRLKGIADQLEDVIEGVPGVLNVDVLGALEREIRVELDPDRLSAFGLTIPEILEFVPAENRNESAGSLETPVVKFNLRLLAEFTGPEDIETLPIASRDGKPIYLLDVGDVRDTFKDRTSYSRLDGMPSVTVSIQKRIGADILLIARHVKAVLAEARKLAPAGTTFEITLDQSKEIIAMVSDLENNIISGLILVVAVLVLFMGWRTSLIVALAIPMSMLMSFAAIQALGYTLNMIVLFSLILALGMLVDNAIVIVENIFRHTEHGMGRVEAAMKGVGEVAWPVITSTATTVAAFCPLLFWPDVMGDFMKYIPITVIITLISSLFVALVISPTVCSMVGGGRRHTHEHTEGRVIRFYRRVLGLALHHRFATMSLTFLLLIAMAVIYGKRGRGVELFPEFDPRQSIINIRAPQGTNINETNRLAKICEQRIAKFSPDFKHVVSNVGSAGGMNFGDGGAGGPHVANLTVMFYDFADRKRPSAKVVEDIHAVLGEFPGAEIKVEKEKMGPPTGAPVTVRFIGEEFKTLQDLSERAKKMISDVPGMINLRSDFESARPEIVFRPNRIRAAQLGVNTFIIGQFLKTAVFGTKVGTYRQFNDEYDITIRLPLSHRQRIDDLLRLRVPNKSGVAVPLSSLGQFEYEGGFGTIQRVDQKRAVTLTADNVKPRLPEEVFKDVQERLAPLGRTRLILVDLRDWREFCQALSNEENSEDAAARRIFNELGWWTRRMIRKCAAGECDEKCRKQDILRETSKIMAGKVFFDPAAIKSDKLPTDIAELLEKPAADLNETELRKLNRMQLEADWPGLIASVERLKMPAGYRITYAGEKEEQDKTAAFLKKAFVIAILLIVLILVAQFNTLSIPLIIISTVVLSMIGVLIGLLVNRMPFGVVMTGIGVISLAGVVVNNAIVLLDYTRKLQRGGMAVIEAAMQAGVTRLRPVFLTAATTILGLIPMATGVSFDFHTFEWVTRSESSQWWASMAWAVIYGLGFATVLTLVFVPTLYVALYRLAARFGLGGLKKTGNGLETGETQ